MSTTSSSIAICDVIVEDRIRSEMGEIDALTNSIKDLGLIEPIVLVPSDMGPRLMAGGRRITALRRLGVNALEYGKHFIWREDLEHDPLRTQACELEENIRRKELTWQEVALGKQKLLEIMEQLHGKQVVGGVSKRERLAGQTDGFGVRKLAAMLGESPASTSKDLSIARAITQAPVLANAPTRESAFRKINIITTVVQMQRTAAVHKANNQGAQTKLWELHKGDFRDLSSQVPSESVDLIYTDLPFGVGLNQMSKHHAGSVINYQDTRDSVVDGLTHLAAESYRILANDRYGVFFFGFNYYAELVEAMEAAGFSVNRVPVIWYKHTNSTENPNTRYGNAYDPALVVMKGTPCFIQPGHQNVIDIKPISSTDRLQIAQQPVQLVERFLRDMTAEGATILDFCAGSGTTGVAATSLKRRAILFEREPTAWPLIEARLASGK